MAAIPTLTQRTVMPNDRPLPLTDPSIATNHNYVSRSLQGVGQDLSNAADPLVAAQARIDAQDNDREFGKYSVEMSSYARTLANGDGTPENPGYLNQQGENALTGYAAAQEALKKKAAELVKMSSNKQVRDRTVFMTGNVISETLGTFSNHAANERVKANDAVDASQILNARVEAVTNPAKLNEALMMNEVTLTKQAIRNGVPKEVLAESLREENTKTIQATIEATLLTSTGTARKLLAMYGDKIDGLTANIIKDKIHAQDMQNLSDAERVEHHNDYLSAKKMEENANQAMGNINTLSHAQIFGMLQTHQIDRQGWNWLESAKHALESGEAKSDPANLFSVDTAIRTGQINNYSQLNDLAANGTITYKDAIEKNALLQSMINNNPILSRADVKQGTDYLTRVLGPQPGFEAQFDDQSKMRFANALEQYQNSAMNNPNQNMSSLYHEIFNSYRPTGDDLGALPRPKMAPIGYNDGKPEDIKANLKKAYIATQEAVNAGTMTQAEANAEFKRIEYYLLLVDQMPTAPVLNTK